MSRMPRRRTAKAHYPRAVIPATELLPELERRRLRALVSADMATAGPLHAEEYWLITPAGSGLTKDGYLEAVASGELGYRVFEPVSEITVLAVVWFQATAITPAASGAGPETVPGECASAP